ncbi:pilin protein [Citrobacter freundii]|nr:pilin protein [Citrobacter freundii]
MKWMKLLLIGGLLTSNAASAFTLVGPTPNVTTTQEYELPSGAPADVKLWDEDYDGVQGYYASAGGYACDYPDVQQTCTHTSSQSTITIMLKEKRSGMIHPFKIQAYMQSLFVMKDGSYSLCNSTTRPLNKQGVISTCNEDGKSIDGQARLLTAWIEQSEMNKLVIGGIWEGQLKLKYTAYGGGNPVNYTANITLKGKATGKQDIYFPEFNGANPLVQLDLHPTGSVTGNSFAEDVTTLDMCLYDGYNSNSDSMTLSFSDEGRAGVGRNEGDFSIYNTGTGGTAAAERIDYHLEMFDPHSKSWMAVKNNNSFVLSAGVNGQDQIRPVRLPSISYPVLCAPTPLRLIVDKFRVTEKAAGYYKGTLHVEFSPSLNSI